MNQPVFTVIVGANGCGKSTLTQWAKSLFQQSAVLDPDAIAVQLKARFQTGWSDIEAGKEVLRSADTFLERWKAFQSKRRSQEALTSRCLRVRVALHTRHGFCTSAPKM